MTILGIETSCDETALSLISAEGGEIAVLAERTLSQIELHRQYGGVFPNLAKREHSRNLIPLLEETLRTAGLFEPASLPYSNVLQNTGIEEIFGKEPELLRAFAEHIPRIKKPPLDAIAVTIGPGLEPCLWTGINLARALSLVWNVPIVPVNHMEGHIFSALLSRKDMGTSNFQLLTFNFPALALLISGGHTELVLMRDWFKYEIIGETRDDAVGEAFDKVARLLGLPYPGGPQISLLAEQARKSEVASPKLKVQSFLTNNVQPTTFNLPRPMLHSNDFDFSFSGLKTAVLYLLKKIDATDERTKAVIAREFEEAITEVLIAKTKKAMQQYGAQTLLIGGGVIANAHVRRSFEALVHTGGLQHAPTLKCLHIPELSLTGDNALMIAVAGCRHFESMRAAGAPFPPLSGARGNLRLNEKI